MKSNTQKNRKQPYRNQSVSMINTKQILKIGDTVSLQINAIGSKGIGISEQFQGITFFIPNVQLGQQVKVKILKLSSEHFKHAIAEPIEIIQSKSYEVPVSIGETLTLKITSSGPKGIGIAELPTNYKIFIPQAHHLESSPIQVKITRIKKNYAFAKIIQDDIFSIAPDDLFIKSSSKERLETGFSNSIEKGMKFNITLPFQSILYRKYLVAKTNNFIWFIKLALGVKAGDLVKVKVTGVFSNFATLKVVKIAPLSKFSKKLKTKNVLLKMLKNGLHLGEKALKCHARMRNFLWLRKKGLNKNRPFLKKNRHIINLLKTNKCLQTAVKKLSKFVLKGKSFLFVGTKKPASGLIARAALLTKTAFFVNTRWLGGMLTNWKTILKSIVQIQPILVQKQTVIKNLLKKRQRIKKYLYKKLYLLKNRSLQLINKGKQLITKIKNKKEQFLENTYILINARSTFLQKTQTLLEKYKELIGNKMNISSKFKILKENLKKLILKKQMLINVLINNKKKLKELQLMLIIISEFLQLKNLKKQQGKKVFSISYKNFVNISSQKLNSSWIIPNPPTVVLNKIINILKKKYENVIQGNNSTNFESLTFQQNNQIKSEKEKVFVFSKLLTKFMYSLSFIKLHMKTLNFQLENNQHQLSNLDKQITSTQKNFLNLKNILNKLNKQINLIKTKLNSKKHFITILKRELKKKEYEQTLLRFLPKFRSLSVPLNQMLNIVQILMKRFVDPKMLYPMEKIYDEKLKYQPKKISTIKKKKWQRLEKYFGGIANMAKINTKKMSNNVAIIIGQQEEINAIHECSKLGIKIFNVVDTNCNPRLADHVIPANDDSRKSIKYILNKMLKYIRLAQEIRKKVINHKNRIIEKQNNN
uniref:Small ribosomal subunit protein uS2c n=1 Tax=Treubaria triappendiculata TaxID=1755147 RepID=A0A0S2LMR8_TRETR|nr:ribosomal protein S2 [Treubaria triappendiculata]ALO62670.1 ribosomal protein S2 [Treubaria triappendiculata]